MELENGYEKEERAIVESATSRGLSFEKAAIIRAKIKMTGLSGYAFVEMLRGRLNDELKNLK